MTGPHPDSDIVPLLAHDHDGLKRLAASLHGLDPGQRDERVRELTVHLVRHEVAEERVVHPAVRTDVLPGDMVAAALLREEADLEELAATLERLDSAGDAFDAVLDGLQSQMIEHMRDEEVMLFPLLRNLEADVRRWDLGNRYARATATAPTRPHPRMPNTRPGIVFAEPIASLIDRVRDRVGSAAE
ncbi:MAG TPA: hemerythrin domain-containing protein [Acidimicrobiales bacterium]|nr:hemerythrin domain-containing protein [Acidimicrobiales bacterium]